MAESKVENVLELPSLVYRLCSKLSLLDTGNRFTVCRGNKGKEESSCFVFCTDKVSMLYSTTMTLLANDRVAINLEDPDEFYVIEKIKKLCNVRNCYSLILFREIFLMLLSFSSG